MSRLFKLLLIEDDESLFHEIKDRLTGWSYDVYGIQDFNQVLQEFAAVKPDCVIIDVQLPKFDGVSLVPADPLGQMFRFFILPRSSC